MKEELKNQLDIIYENHVSDWRLGRNKNIQSDLVKSNNEFTFNKLKESLRVKLVKKGYEFENLSDNEKLDKESYIHKLLSDFISLHNQLQ